MLLSIIGILLVTNVLLPIFLGLLHYLLYVWTRGRVRLNVHFVWYQDLKYSRFSESKSLEEIGACCTWFVFDLCVGIIIYLLFLYISTTYDQIYLLIIPAIFAFIYIPMYLFDLFYMLRYNVKSRDSDRLKELEERLAKIER